MKQIDDFIVSYPSSSVEGIQTLISAKKEFYNVSAFSQEPAPIPGKSFYNNQLFFLRYMIYHDRIFLYGLPGTGKLCSYDILSEHFFNLYQRDPASAPIRGSIGLAPGPGLVDDMRQQIICRCTSGKYVTEKVLSSGSRKAQKSAIKKEVGKWHILLTYEKLAKQLRDMTDEQIKTAYSNFIIFIDEAHHLSSSSPKKKKDEDRLVYYQIWRLTHLVEGSKVIISTGSPVVNETSEIAPLLNIILDRDHQLPTKWNYDEVTVEQLEPYLRGKISYIRNLDTGIKLELMGEEIEFQIDEDQIPIKTILATSLMGDIQRQAYFEAKNLGQSNVYYNERQVSSFVFPDGTWGGKKKDPKSPFSRYVLNPLPGLYFPSPELEPWLKVKDNPRPNEPHLGRISCKYEKTIRHLREEKEGTIYIYNDAVEGSGAIVQGLTLAANGYEVYTGDVAAFEDIEGLAVPHPCSNETKKRRVTLKKKERYALITGETKGENIIRILDLFSFPGNYHGEYLRIIVGSDVTAEGLSLPYGKQVHIETKWWNPIADYQIIHRIVRATSHLLLIDEARQRLIDEGKDPNDAVIPVKIFHHTALYNENNLDDSVDIRIQEISESKGYYIYRLERILKQIAVDCQINRQRNIRSNDEDYSKQCDYDKCDYPCYDPYPEEDDYSTYDVYYLEGDLQPVMTSIDLLFSGLSLSHFSLRLLEIYNLLPDIREDEINRALVKMVEEKYPIYDRYGFLSYLREDDDTYFLRRDFPTSLTSSSQSLVDYVSNIITVDQVSLPDYLYALNFGTQEDIMADIFNLSSGSKRLDDLLDELTPENKIDLLERSFVISLDEEQVLPILPDLIEKLDLIYILTRPDETIAAAEIIERLPPVRPGRPRLNEVRPETIKLEDVKEGIKILTPEEFLTTPNAVVVHSLRESLFTRASYNVTARAKGGGKNIRLLDPSEGREWRNLNPIESEAYSVAINELSEQILNPFEELGVFGTILYDEKFRIVDKTLEGKRAKKSKTDRRTPARGRDCSVIGIPNLLRILWELKVPLPARPNDYPTIKNSADGAEKLRRKINQFIKMREVETWPVERLQTYLAWSYQGKVEDLCLYIKDFFARTGRLIT